MPGPLNLRALRERLQMTQRAVAAAVGVSTTAVRHWERGAAPSPRNSRKLEALVQLRRGTLSLADLDAVRPVAGGQGPWPRARIVALWRLAANVVEGRACA